jgi:hypothetical protein
LHREDISSQLYEQLIRLTTSELASSEDGILSTLALSEEEMEAMLRQVLQKNWLLEQLDDTIDETVSYLTGEKPNLAIKVELAEPLDRLEPVLVVFLSKEESYDYILTEMLAPALQQNLGEVTELPLGMELTDDEIIAAARDILSPEWYRTLVDDLVAQIFAYLRGTEEELELIIPLADRKSEIAETLGELADKKVEGAFNGLPACSLEHLQEFLSKPSLENILCRPGDMSYGEFKELVGIDVASIVQPLIELGIPDEWILTEADINQVLGGQEGDNLLLQIQELVQEGLTFDEEGLGELIGADTSALGDIRQQIAVALTFTERDLRDLMGDGTDQQETFNGIRTNLGTAKQWINFIWIAPLLLLVAVGALGGRQWSSRLIWAAAPLVAMAAIGLISFGPVFSAAVQPVIDQMLAGLNQMEGVTPSIAEKGVTLMNNVVDSFVGGLRNQSLGILIASVVLIGAGVVWHNWDKIRGD